MESGGRRQDGHTRARQRRAVGGRDHASTNRDRLQWLLGRREGGQREDQNGCAARHGLLTAR
jgi:hypothetical protein